MVLKLGLVIDDEQVPYWASRTIGQIIGSGIADIALVVSVGIDGRSKVRRSLLYRAYASWDRAVNERVADPLALKDLPTGLEGAERMRLARDPRDPGAVATEDIALINDQALDVLIDLGTGVPRGELSRCARYGLLSFAPGDGELYPGHPPGFWEVYDGSPMTGSRVLRTAGDAVTIVYRSYSCTMAGSERWNRGQVYHKGISFIPRVLRDLDRRGESALAPLPSGPALEGQARPGPHNFDMLNYFLGRAPKNAALLAGKALYEERWALRYKREWKSPGSFDGFSILMSPPHTWWADPQVARQDDEHYIFIEELPMPPRKNRAHISVIAIGADGKVKGPTKVLERPYHLSYPFVFEWKGVHYMVPESSHNRTIELYEAVEFPYCWRYLRDLMTGISAVDSTLVHRDGRWWLFTNIRENEGASFNDELFLFSSSDLLAGEWRPHPLNPIISDVRSSRPAGRLFEVDDVLYRPSQDSSRGYGYAVNINRVLKMDDEHYNEEQIAYVEPRAFPGASRVHTFSHLPSLTVVDTYMPRSRLAPGH